MIWLKISTIFKIIIDSNRKKWNSQSQNTIESLNLFELLLESNEIWMKKVQILNQIIIEWVKKVTFLSKLNENVAKSSIKWWFD